MVWVTFLKGITLTEHGNGQVEVHQIRTYNNYINYYLGVDRRYSEC